MYRGVGGRPRGEHGNDSETGSGPTHHHHCSAAAEWESGLAEVQGGWENCSYGAHEMGTGGDEVYGGEGQGAGVFQARGGGSGGYEECGREEGGMGREFRQEWSPFLVQEMWRQSFERGGGMEGGMPPGAWVDSEDGKGCHGAALMKEDMGGQRGREMIAWQRGGTASIAAALCESKDVSADKVVGGYGGGRVWQVQGHGGGREGGSGDEGCAGEGARAVGKIHSRAAWGNEKRARFVK